MGWVAGTLCDSRRVDFTVETREVGGITVVVVAGELDAHSAPTLDAVLSPLSQRHEGELVVDLSSVGFIDSTGLGILVSTLKHVRESDGRLDVVVATPRVLKVFSLTGLDVVIPLHATLDGALAR
ncbi:MAG: anti-sigma factor antagonist [Actinomycetota bacterium]|nr:anti-sigma factor antagonist [Actinomycetota bacterium]